MGFDALVKRAQQAGPRKLVVVGGHESKLLRAVSRACADGIATALLLGDTIEMRRIAEQEGIDIGALELEQVDDRVVAAEMAMEMVRDGSVGAVMKGKTTTADLMHVALKGGLRKKGQLLSHIAVFSHPRLGADKLVVLSDAGLVPFPTLEQRVQIIKNAVTAARALGVAEPKVAVLASNEEVDESIPVSVHAARLKEMNRPGGELDGYGVIDGPYDLFSAVDVELAAVKGLGGPVAGQADVLHCPDVVAGNLMSKAVIYFAQESRTGGCVVGGTVPVILLSRASSADDKYLSILVGLTCSA